MKLAYISRKLVNVDNILYINPDEREDGSITCLFVLSKDFILQEIYQNREEFEMKMLEYGITKFNYAREIITLIKKFFKKIEHQNKKKNLRRVK